MSSLNGRIAAPYLAPYAASKYALEAISDALQRTSRLGIEVSLIEPGSHATPIWDKSFAAADELEAASAREGLALYEADFAAVLRQPADGRHGAAGRRGGPRGAARFDRPAAEDPLPGRLAGAILVLPGSGCPTGFGTGLCVGPWGCRDR